MARDVLSQLQKLLSKNKHLTMMLASKIARNQQSGSYERESHAVPPATGEMNSMELDIERQLQAHGFDFTDPMGLGQSPETESLNSDRVGRSPPDYSTQTPMQQPPTISPGTMLDSFLQSPQHTGSLEVGPNQTAHTTNGLDQDFPAMDFNFNTFPTSNGNSFGTFQGSNWQDYNMPDQSADFSGSVYEATWPQHEHSRS